MQFWSRMAPSARRQFEGYRRMRTGMTPADVRWQLWMGAPPGRRTPGLRRLR
jgi:hypothetical protein